MGFGINRKIIIQQAAPASSGTQVVSAPPQARKTSHKARLAPAHTGNKSNAIINLIHFATRQRLAALGKGCRKKGRRLF